MLSFLWSLIKKGFKFGFYLAIASVILVSVINWHINSYSEDYIYEKTDSIPKCYTALVLGAFVYNNGNPSGILRDRLDKGIELYTKKKINRFLLSGDHGTFKYDEVNNMKEYLLNKGVSTKDIFLDHAGFDTYNSAVRAKEIFNVENVIIVTQEFHLARAVYIARKKGLNAFGAIADKLKYPSLPYLKKREWLARIKAFIEVVTNRDPKFLGPKIPITGDSRLSYD